MASTKWNGFNYKECLPLKRNDFHYKEWLPLKGMSSTRGNGFHKNE